MNKIKKKRNNTVFEGFIKKKGQLGYKYIILERDLLYLLNTNTL